MNAGLLSLAAVLLGGTLLAAELPEGQSFTNSIGMKLVRIEPGKFVMGCGDAPPKSLEEWKARDWDESPQHKVKISQPFFMAACEVTNAQYEQFDPKHKEMRGKFGAYGQGNASKTDDEPVTMVTWQQAVDFCNWLAKKEGKPYRLPTEAEWEYACRAGTTTIYNTGDTLTPEQADMGLAKDGKAKIATVPVGSYAPNAWGLCDMHGNVEEWCLDWHGPYTAGEQTDPVGRADGYAKVTRGGSYNIPSYQPSSARFCRSSNRSGHIPEDANRCTGFRVVLGEPPAGKPLPAPEPALCQRDVKQSPAPKDGPDPSQPFFNDFAGRRPTIPPNTWGPIFSKWNHDTALCVCPNGDVLAIWYTTVGEEGRELALAASRLPAGGDQWQPASSFFEVPDVNDHAPALLCDGKRIFHFSNQALASWVDAAVIMRTSDDSGATWSKPQIIVPRGKSPINPASDNMPVGTCIARDGTYCLVLDAGGNSSCLAVSRDKGETWTLTRGLICGIHAALAPLDDGSLAAFGRTGKGQMPVSHSRNMGESWEVSDTPFGPINVGQKAATLRLAGGAMLLCGPDTAKVAGKPGVFAALSFDEGKTWKHVRNVPGVKGYLSVAQAPNGVIYLFGTEMTCAAFNEAWLKQGPPPAAPATSPASRPRDK